MKKVKRQIIIPRKIKFFNSLFALSLMTIFVVIGLAIVFDLRILGIVPAVSLPLFYLLYRRLFLSHCEICLDCCSKIVTVTTPFSTKSFDFCDVRLVIKKTGFRSPSYIITILNASGNKIIRFRDDHWDNVQNIIVLPKSNDNTTKAFIRKWK